MKFALYLILLGALFWLVRKTFTPRIAMSRDEAARVLNIAADADADTIREAHRRLIAKLHPDSGGSPELAAQINRARDVLLSSLNS